jgi:hypothetical protein
VQHRGSRAGYPSGTRRYIRSQEFFYPVSTRTAGMRAARDRPSAHRQGDGQRVAGLNSDGLQTLRVGRPSPRPRAQCAAHCAERLGDVSRPHSQRRASHELTSCLVSRECWCDDGASGNTPCSRGGGSTC